MTQSFHHVCLKTVTHWRYSQRFQKIKKETVAAGNGDTNTSSDPVTPVRKRAAKSQSGSTAKKHKGSKAGTSVQDEGDANTDDDEIRKNAEVIKKEEVVDDEYVSPESRRETKLTNT